MEFIGKPVYGLIDNSLFGFRFMAGIVTGFRLTDGDPLYEVSFGKNSAWTSKIAFSKEALMNMIELPTFDRIKETHGLTLKFNQ